MSVRLTFGVALATVALTAHAATGTSSVYKCALDGGGVMYQDAPCPAGRELRDFDREPAEVSVLPFAPAPPTRPASTGAAKPGKRGDSAKSARSASERHAKPGGGDAAQRKFLAPGIGVGEVLTRIGAPDMKSQGKGKRLERWTYLPTSADANTVTTLTFDAGRLIEVERKIVR
ncbi:MAG TPA: hypothetical protein VMV45_21540 [Casimicrobiaceae bacterium]|nr:hypothetical protein [Casimicrobiaceae bacterium]